MAQEEQPTDYSCLSDDLWLKIFLLLEPDDLSRCAMQCKAWRTLARSQELWKSIVSKLLGKELVQQFEDHVTDNDWVAIARVYLWCPCKRSEIKDVGAGPSRQAPAREGRAAEEPGQVAVTVQLEYVVGRYGGPVPASLDGRVASYTDATDENLKKLRGLSPCLGVQNLAVHVTPHVERHRSGPLASSGWAAETAWAVHTSTSTSTAPPTATLTDPSAMHAARAQGSEGETTAVASASESSAATAASSASAPGRGGAYEGAVSGTPAVSRIQPSGWGPQPINPAAPTGQGAHQDGPSQPLGSGTAPRDTTRPTGWRDGPNTARPSPPQADHADLDQATGSAGFPNGCVRPTGRSTCSHGHIQPTGWGTPPSEPGWATSNSEHAQFAGWASLSSEHVQATGWASSNHESIQDTEWGSPPRERVRATRSSQPRRWASPPAGPNQPTGWNDPTEPLIRPTGWGRLPEASDRAATGWGDLELEEPLIRATGWDAPSETSGWTVVEGTVGPDQGLLGAGGIAASRVAGMGGLRWLRDRDGYAVASHGSSAPQDVSCAPQHNDGLHALCARGSVTFAPSSASDVAAGLLASDPGGGAPDPEHDAHAAHAAPVGANSPAIYPADALNDALDAALDDDVGIAHDSGVYADDDGRGHGDHEDDKGKGTQDAGKATGPSSVCAKPGVGAVLSQGLTLAVSTGDRGQGGQAVDRVQGHVNAPHGSGNDRRGLGGDGEGRLGADAGRSNGIFVLASQMLVQGAAAGDRGEGVRREGLMPMAADADGSIMGLEAVSVCRGKDTEREAASSCLGSGAVCGASSGASRSDGNSSLGGSSRGMRGVDVAVSSGYEGTQENGKGFSSRVDARARVGSPAAADIGDPATAPISSDHGTGRPGAPGEATAAPMAITAAAAAAADADAAFSGREGAGGPASTPEQGRTAASAIGRDDGGVASGRMGGGQAATVSGRTGTSPAAGGWVEESQRGNGGARDGPPTNHHPHHVTDVSTSGDGGDGPPSSNNNGSVGESLPVDGSGGQGTAAPVAGPIVRGTTCGAILGATCGCDTDSFMHCRGVLLELPQGFAERFTESDSAPGAANPQGSLACPWCPARAAFVRLHSADTPRFVNSWEEDFYNDIALLCMRGHLLAWNVPKPQDELDSYYGGTDFGDEEDDDAAGEDVFDAYAYDVGGYDDFEGDDYVDFDNYDDDDDEDYLW